MSMTAEDQNVIDDFINDLPVTKQTTLLFQDEQPPTALNYVINKLQSNQFQLQEFLKLLYLPNINNLKQAVANAVASNYNVISINRTQAVELLTLGKHLYNDTAYLLYDRRTNETTTRPQLTQQSLAQPPPPASQLKRQHAVNLTQINTIQNMVNKINSNNVYKNKLQTIVDSLKNAYTESLLQTFLDVYKEYIREHDMDTELNTSAANINKIFTDIETLHQNQQNNILTQQQQQQHNNNNESQSILTNKNITIAKTPSPSAVPDTNLKQHNESFSSPPQPPPLPINLIPPPPPPPPPPPFKEIISQQQPSVPAQSPASEPPLTKPSLSDLLSQKNKLTPVAAQQQPAPVLNTKEQMLQQIRSGTVLKKTNNLVNLENKNLNAPAEKKNTNQISDISKAIINKMEAKRNTSDEESSASLSEHYDGWSDTEESQKLRSMQKSLNSKLYLLTNENIIKNEKNIIELQNARKLIDSNNLDNMKMAHELLLNYQLKLQLKYDKNYENPLTVKGKLTKPLYLLDINKFKYAIEDLINMKMYAKAYEELQSAQSANVMAPFITKTMQHLKIVIDSETANTESEV
ncbi:ORF1629 [Artaxa digramma nucleopolyhedrovirus]|uniref:ORF1629 n=1 Tax=Artaxa digramma nucleopolyhedrovirus TaxID=3070910 RepID=A0AAE6R709_9ABAC|nr:ORF1629 [Euproctis digramma nucleopolyhedrovirus]QHB21661.1 ORF1629 [Artaxa digramma nucleopolyhedrovirus]